MSKKGVVKKSINKIWFWMVLGLLVGGATAQRFHATPTRAKADELGVIIRDVQGKMYN